LKHHGDLARQLSLADFENAVKISGTGFFFLLGDLALLDLAIQRYAIDLLLKKGFVLVQPPLLLNRRAYETVVSLAEFENVMYKVENQDLYLIATSEHPLVSRFLDHSFSPRNCPKSLPAFPLVFAAKSESTVWTNAVFFGFTSSTK
jgi:seryl-tRNA synthetase